MEVCFFRSRKKVKRVGVVHNDALRKSGLTGSQLFLWCWYSHVVQFVRTFSASSRFTASWFGLSSSRNTPEALQTGVCLISYTPKLQILLSFLFPSFFLCFFAKSSRVDIIGQKIKKYSHSPPACSPPVSVASWCIWSPRWPDFRTSFLIWFFTLIFYFSNKKTQTFLNSLLRRVVLRPKLFAGFCSLY